MPADVAEVCAFEPDAIVEDVVGSSTEMGLAEHDPDLLRYIRSDTDQLVKAAVLAGSIGFAYRSPDRTGRRFA